MLTKITDVPSHVAGFTATGEITKDDYDNVLIPELEKIDKEHGHIHYLLVLQTPVKNFTAGAWLQDAWIGFKHLRGWKKIAVVTDEKAVETFTDKFGALIPGQTKGFKLAELQAAKEWVAKED